MGQLRSYRQFETVCVPLACVLYSYSINRRLHPGEQMASPDFFNNLHSHSESATLTLLLARVFLIAFVTPFPRNFNTVAHPSSMCQ